MLHFISLFAGIGGIDLGLERAGMTPAMQVEIDPFCQKVLRARWPYVPKHDDVFTFNRSIWNGRADLICGGDPCQQNSNARRNGEALSPSLGGEFIRIVDEFRPRLVLRENPSVVRRDAPWPWWRFRNELERLNYAVLPFRFRACCSGADHRRERLFLLAELQDANSPRLEGHERQEMARTHRWRQDPDPAGSARRRPASRLRGRTDGVPHWMDRLRALGNADDPGVMEAIGAWIIKGVR